MSLKDCGMAHVCLCYMVLTCVMQEHLSGQVQLMVGGYAEQRVHPDYPGLSSCRVQLVVVAAAGGARDAIPAAAMQGHL